MTPEHHQEKSYDAVSPIRPVEATTPSLKVYLPGLTAKYDLPDPCTEHAVVPTFFQKPACTPKPNLNVVIPAYKLKINTNSV